MYPCATYVVKRLGIDMSPVDLYDFPGEIFEEGATVLHSGDVLIWDWRKDNPATDVVLGQGDNHMKIKLSLSKKTLVELHDRLNRHIDRMLTAPNKIDKTLENTMSSDSSKYEGE